MTLIWFVCQYDSAVNSTSTGPPPTQGGGLAGQIFFPEGKNCAEGSASRFNPLA
jgi:hypothetical protein